MLFRPPASASQVENITVVQPSEEVEREKHILKLKIARLEYEIEKELKRQSERHKEDMKLENARLEYQIEKDLEHQSERPEEEKAKTPKASCVGVRI